MSETPETKPNPVGRPSSMTPEVISKLEEVFAIGGSDAEACFYADISHQTLYKYQNENPEFTERKNALKERPILKARQTIIKNLDDADTAKWFLQRKKKGEFSERQELTGAEGKPLILPSELIAKNENANKDNLPQEGKE